MKAPERKRGGIRVAIGVPVKGGWGWRETSQVVADGQGNGRGAREICFWERGYFEKKKLRIVDLEGMGAFKFSPFLVFE